MQGKYGSLGLYEAVAVSVSSSCGLKRILCHVQASLVDRQPRQLNDKKSFVESNILKNPCFP